MVIYYLNDKNKIKTKGMINMKINLNDQNQCMKVFGKKQISVNQYITNENGKFAVIENSEGKFLIQKTSKEKGENYATTGGHVLSGETSKEAIIRETEEELGIDISKENIIYIGDLLFGIPIGEIYYLKKELDISKLKLQQEGVKKVEYLSEDEILKLIETDKIIKSHGLMFKKLLEKSSSK